MSPKMPIANDGKINLSRPYIDIGREFYNHNANKNHGRVYYRFFEIVFQVSRLWK